MFHPIHHISLFLFLKYIQEARRIGCDRGRVLFIIANDWFSYATMAWGHEAQFLKRWNLLFD